MGTREEYDINTGSIYDDLCRNWKKHPRQLFSEVEERLEFLLDKKAIKKDTLFTYELNQNYLERYIKEAKEFQIKKKDIKSPPMTEFFMMPYHNYYGYYIIPFDTYFLVTYENDPSSYEFFFVLKLRVLDLMKMNNFLLYHLDVNFNNDFNQYKEWLDTLLIKYRELLVNGEIDILLKKFIATPGKTAEPEVKDPYPEKLNHPHSFEFVSEITQQHKADASTLNKLIEDMLNSLKNPKAGFISEKTKLPQLKRTFSGHPIYNPIDWIGTVGELQYFIRLLHPYQLQKDLAPSKPVIKNIKNNIWATTLECFMGTNKTGEPFEKEMLRKAKQKDVKADKQELLRLAVQHLL